VVTMVSPVYLMSTSCTRVVGSGPLKSDTVLSDEGNNPILALMEGKRWDAGVE